MLTNRNQQTGLPFGVVSGSSLDAEIQSELFMKAQGIVYDSLFKEEMAELAGYVKGRMYGLDSEKEFQYNLPLSGWHNAYDPEKHQEVVNYCKGKSLDEIEKRTIWKNTGVVWTEN